MQILLGRRTALVKGSRGERGDVKRTDGDVAQRTCMWTYGRTKLKISNRLV